MAQPRLEEVPNLRRRGSEPRNDGHCKLVVLGCQHGTCGCAIELIFGQNGLGA